jgi:putative endopeptidase
MSDETRMNAIEKLDAMGVKMGYPDSWKDYTPLKDLVTKDLPYLEKIAAIYKWGYDSDVAKINQPVDMDQWQLTPQTVFFTDLITLGKCFLRFSKQ